LAPDDPVRGYVDEITSSAHRAAELTRQLLAIGRRQIIRPEAMDLDDAVSDRLRKIHRLVGSVPALTWVAGAGSHTVALDPSQFDQILAELCVNARDAIQAAGRPGEIRVSTAQSVVTAEDGGPGTSVEPGEYVVLSVADNGCGMNAETLEHLFEPFFTTKPVGEGLGLGLATVFGIVRQNGGTVEVDSNPGAGTRVRVLLPRLTAQSSAAAASSFTPPGVSDPHGEHSAGSA
jgi:signal transduction histidine kinase